MSTFIGTVRIAFDFEDCYVLEVGTGGKVYLQWRSPNARDREFAQRQLNDTVTALKHISVSAGLEWPV